MTKASGPKETPLPLMSSIVAIRRVTVSLPILLTGAAGEPAQALSASTPAARTQNDRMTRAFI